MLTAFGFCLIVLCSGAVCPARCVQDTRPASVHRHEEVHVSEQEKLAQVIAQAIAQALATAQAQTAAPAPDKPKGKRKGKPAPVGTGTLERGGAKFTFTLVQAGIRGGAYDKYSVRVERNGRTHDRGWKIPAGVSVQEYATAKRLDLIAGLTAKYFA